MAVEPVPFYLPLPGRDTLGLDGAQSISYRVHGMLHLDDDMATFEWITTRHSEQVSFFGVDVDDEETQPELLDLPVSWIAGAALKGAWWRPRLVLRSRRLDAFDGAPGGGRGTITLRIRREDRQVARTMADALADAGRTWALGDGDSDPRALR